ncbi:MAG: UvrD-helicase domain-containing protein, partial [Mariprofundaceae bacterium]
MSREIRLQARHPGVSCLVQAPAGSGKTELLTQRILALLAVVDEPEEILALTFTRKAAAEMRRRVMDALNMARPDEPEAVEGGEVSHRMETWRLARQARQRSGEKGWHLAAYPSRLRIMTLDSLTHMLARQLPLLSGLGDSPTPMEHASAAYRQAAEGALQEAMRDYPEDAGQVLLHQDHNAVAVVGLLADMLVKREQWLEAVARHGRDMDGLRHMLEVNLAEIMGQQLRRCDALLPVASKAALPALIRFAGDNVGDAEMQAFKAWPAAELDTLLQWQTLADFLLVAGKPQLRKSVNKGNGFPAGKEYQAEKEQCVELLAELAAVPDLADALHRVRQLPVSAAMDEGQWQVLKSLFLLLVLANKQLQQLFASLGEADFTEIALRAMDALGAHDEAPGDLLMKLDYRIRHILVDEFQDTSHLQMDLLQCLTAGWQEGDGRHRTLFMVGDPMQSIYRFRKAEVGLFLNAAANDAGLPAVDALQLERNFRSAPAIVDWVNAAFLRIFPARQDVVSGAVAHAPAEAALTHAGSVHVHLQRGRDDALEARAVVKLVREQLALPVKEGGGARIGILAKSRKHLHAIMPALAEAGIAYRAIKILPLYARPEVRLLRALLRALLHPADRASWAAILRAPCCGLISTDIYALMGDEGVSDKPLWTLLTDEKNLQRVSEDGQARANHVRRALEPCLALAGRAALRELLECAWQRLSMPRLIDATAERNVQAALELVASMDKGGHIDFSLFDERLNDLYAAPDASEAAGRVELLTMHGAKGLQWDMVILPGLGKTGGQTDTPLVAFSDVPVSGGASLLMAAKAPMRASDALYDLVREVEKMKDNYELQRLLYVACTRAETSLHLLGHVSEKSEKAASASLLGLLLANDAGCFGARISWLDAAGEASATVRLPLRRMARIPQLSDATSEPVKAGETEYSWAGPEAAPVGTAVHAALQYIGELGIEG